MKTANKASKTPPPRARGWTEYHFGDTSQEFASPASAGMDL